MNWSLPYSYRSVRIHIYWSSKRVACEPPRSTARRSSFPEPLGITARVLPAQGIAASAIVFWCCLIPLFFRLAGSRSGRHAAGPFAASRGTARRSDKAAVCNRGGDARHLERRVVAQARRRPVGPRGTNRRPGAMVRVAHQAALVRPIPGKASIRPGAFRPHVHPRLRAARPVRHTMAGAMQSRSSPATRPAGCPRPPYTAATCPRIHPVRKRAFPHRRRRSEATSLLATRGFLPVEQSRHALNPRLRGRHTLNPADHSCAW